MGLIGIILLLIICLICYNVWFNLKYTEGEQIMMRFKKEKKEREKISKKVKEHLRAEYFPENPMLEIVNETLDERQKYALILFLSIINTDYFDKKKLLQDEYIDDLIKLLKVTNQGFADYSDLVRVNNKIYKNHLKTFQEEQKIYLMVFMIEMLEQGGKPTDIILEKTQNKVNTFLNITQQEYNVLKEKATNRLNNYKTIVYNEY
jgi:hypothetical protein